MLEISALLANASLMRGRNTHILAVFRYRAASHLYAFGLQAFRNVFVGEWMRCILLFDHFLYSALQDQQRRAAARRPLHRLREEVAQLKYALRRVRVLARNRAAHGGRMHPY